jgi:hypothetical protein
MSDDGGTLDVAPADAVQMTALPPPGRPDYGRDHAQQTQQPQQPTDPAAKWKEKALQLRGHLEVTGEKLKVAQQEAADAARQLARRAAEVSEKEAIIEQLRQRAQEFLKSSDDKSRQRAAEVHRLEGLVKQHEAAAQQSRLRRSRPIQVALRIQDARSHGDVWCLVDYQKPSVAELGGSGGSGRSGNGAAGGDDDEGGTGSGGSETHAVISEWERQDVVVARVRQTFGLELALPPVITSADILELRGRIRALEDELGESKEAYRKCVVVACTQKTARARTRRRTAPQRALSQVNE